MLPCLQVQAAMSWDTLSSPPGCSNHNDGLARNAAIRELASLAQELHAVLRQNHILEDKIAIDGQDWTDQPMASGHAEHDVFDSERFRGSGPQVLLCPSNFNNHSRGHALLLWRCGLFGIL